MTRAEQIGVIGVERCRHAGLISPHVGQLDGPDPDGHRMASAHRAGPAGVLKAIEATRGSRLLVVGNA